jgi:hypothetical protein
MIFSTLSSRSWLRFSGIAEYLRQRLCSTLRVTFGSDEADFDVDIAARGYGVRAGLVCGVHRGPCNVALQTRQGDAVARSEGVSAISKAQLHFDVVGEGLATELPLEAQRCFSKITKKISPMTIFSVSSDHYPVHL